MKTRLLIILFFLHTLGNKLLTFLSNLFTKSPSFLARFPTFNPPGRPSPRAHAGATTPRRPAAPLAQPAQPAQPAPLAQPAQPTEPAQPVEPAQPGATTRITSPPMRFESVHSYKAPADAVGSALVDPAFYAELDLPDVGRPRLDAHTRDGAVHRLVTTWVYSGELDPLARRVVGSHKISWSQTLVFDEATMTGSLDITSAIQPGRISCRASVNVIVV